MIVICIKNNNGWRQHITDIPFLEGPEFGDICTVVGENNMYPECPAYYLLEWPDLGGWAKKDFIQCSEIDEKEFERNYNTLTA